MKRNRQYLIFISTLCIGVFISLPTLTGSPVEPLDVEGLYDFDPTSNIVVTVEIQKIRSLEKFDNHIPTIEKIDWFSDPDFYVKIICNGEEQQSDVWMNQKYIYEPWSVSFDVPDDEEVVNITIQLGDWNPGADRLCDISTAYYDDNLRDSYDVELQYSIATGHWTGDDLSESFPWVGDVSGYGRLNGCDDGSVLMRERDCELWFEISQTDPDGDNIPYYIETEWYHTDPEVDNSDDDQDGDGVPLWWEHTWGHAMVYHQGGLYHGWMFNDSVYDNHTEMDPDDDGLNNYEEYLTSQWGSDPYRPDIFVEMDRMADSPDGFESNLPEGSKELIRTAFNRRNIVFHLDDGCMGEQDIIPFEEFVERPDLEQMYQEYFLHNDPNHWRRGIFRYGVVVFQADINGYVFKQDAYQISTNGMETKIFPDIQSKRDIVYASAYMHELGHTLGFTPIGGHDLDSYYPWQFGWWKWRPYKSVMNYGYMYKMVDYSDGSRQRNDFDDWQRLDLSWFDEQWF